MVQVDSGWLGEVLGLLADAIGAVARGNTRAAGNRMANRCASAIIATGIRPADCPTS